MRHQLTSSSYANFSVCDGIYRGGAVLVIWLFSVNLPSLEDPAPSRAVKPESSYSFSNIRCSTLLHAMPSVDMVLSKLAATGPWERVYETPWLQESATSSEFRMQQTNAHSNRMLIIGKLLRNAQKPHACPSFA